MSVFRARGAAPALNLHPGYVPGVWYGTWEGTTATSTAVSAVDTLHLYAFRLLRPVTMAQLAMRCQTGGAASEAKCAIWRNGTGRPTGVPITGINTGQATTATATVAYDITDITLVPGVYWAGAVFTGTLPTMSHIATSAFGAYLSGSAASVNALTAHMMGVTAPMTYANDITATDLTSATFTAVSAAAGLPVVAFLVV